MDSKLHFSSSNSQKTTKTHFLEMRFCKRLPGRSQPELLRRFSKPFGSLSRFVVCKFELRGVISYQSIEITGEIRSFDAWIFSESTFSSRSNSVDLIHIIQFSAKITRENCPIGLFPVVSVVQSWSKTSKDNQREFCSDLQRTNHALYPGCLAASPRSKRCQNNLRTSNSQEFLSGEMTDASASFAG